MTGNTFTLVDRQGRKYLTSEERGRFLAAASREPKPDHQTFALTLAHSGARVSELLALRPVDIDLDATAIRIRTLKRRADHWREVPLPADHLRALELVHGLRSISTRRASKPVWPWSRATGHRRIVAVMERAGISGPQACPKGLRHAFGIAAVAAGVPLPTIAAVLGHADISTTAIYTTAVGIEARQFLARMWPQAEARTADWRRSGG